MDERVLLSRIKEIVYAVPDEIYKYSKPDEYWDDEEWANTPSVEKGFILIKELIENADIEKYQKDEKENVKKEEVKVLKLGKGPTFWNQADENMFFNAIYSLASFVKVEGRGRDLYLHYSGELSKEEKNFLSGLLKRYQMEIPTELQ